MLEKEKGFFRKTLESVGKVATIISIPLEIILLSYGLITGNKLEIFLGGGGLIADVFLLKWLGRKEKGEVLKTPLAQLTPATKGSHRLALTT